MAEFKKLRGNRVFLEFPRKEDSKLYVDHNTKEALEEEMVKKLGRLKVYAVGDLISDIEKGDYVLVDPEALAKAKRVPLSEAKSVILVSQFDIALVW
jgi:hypothetical protein